MVWQVLIVSYLFSCVLFTTQDGSCAVVYALKSGHSEAARTLLDKYRCKATKTAVSPPFVL